MSEIVYRKSDVITEIKQPPKVLPHARKRADERFEGGAKRFVAWVAMNFKKFEYVSLTYGYEGKLSRMYYFKGHVIIFALNDNTVITTFPATNKKKNESSIAYVERLKKLGNSLDISKEINRIEKDERRMLRVIETVHADLLNNISELRRKLSRARSLPSQISIKAMINAIEYEINELDSDRLNTKLDKQRKLQGLFDLYRKYSEGQTV